MFHSSTAPDEDGIMDAYKCIEFGKDSKEDLGKALSWRVGAAITEGLSRSYVDKLHSLIQEDKQVFRVRLANEGPADIPNLKIKLDNLKNW